MHDGRPEAASVRYIEADLYDYLTADQQDAFDVTSALATLQWVMLQRGVEAGLLCLERLAARTKRVCMVEMPYTEGESYVADIPVEINRRWVEEAMYSRGHFDEVRVIEASPVGLLRDLSWASGDLRLVAQMSLPFVERFSGGRGARHTSAYGR